MQWKNFIARTAVRRVVWIVVGVAVYAIAGLFSGDASAQDFSQCRNYSSNTSGITLACESEGMAYLNAAAHAQARAGRGGGNFQYCGAMRVTGGTRAYRGYYKEFSFQNCANMPQNMGGWFGRSWPAGTECPNGVDANSPTGCVQEACPDGQYRDPDTGECKATCENRPSFSNSASAGSLPVCQGGCLFTPSTGEGLSMCLNSDSNAIPVMCGAATWKPTGAACDTAPNAPPPSPWDPNKETCRSTGGGFSECVKPDGSHCVTGARGGRYCWGSGEEGARMSQDGTEGATRTKSPNPETPPPAPTPPPGMENPTAISTTGTTINGNQYNTTNYGGSGNSGGQSNTGNGGKQPGEEGEKEEVGSPGAGVEKLHEAGEATIGSIYGAFSTRVSNAPILQAGQAFFTIPNSGGSCPTWTIPASEWTPALVFDFFCNPTLMTILGYAGYILMAVAAMRAFHIGIGD